jgi:hypothetical protein
MRTIRVRVSGTCPLMMNNPEVMLTGSVPTAGVRGVKTKEDPRVVAERLAYRTADGVLFAPSEWLFRSLRQASKSYKVPGLRSSLFGRFAGTVRVHEPHVVLLDADDEPLKNYELDTRLIRSATGSAIPAYRPRIDKWQAQFHLLVNEQFIDPDMVKRCADDAGAMVGVGAYRLQLGGPFGGFTVTEWREVASTTGEATERARKKVKGQVPATV